MNQFIRNAHSVPLIDLFTLNLAIIIGLAYLAKYYGYYDNTCFIIFAFFFFFLFGFVVCGSSFFDRFFTHCFFLFGLFVRWFVSFASTICFFLFSSCSYWLFLRYKLFESPVI